MLLKGVMWCSVINTKSESLAKCCGDQTDCAVTEKQEEMRKQKR